MSWTGEGGALRRIVDLAAFQDIASHVLARIHVLHIDFVLYCGQPADFNCGITAFASVTLFSLSNSDNYPTSFTTCVGFPGSGLVCPESTAKRRPRLLCDLYAVTEVEVLEAVSPLSETDPSEGGDGDVMRKTHPIGPFDSRSRREGTKLNSEKLDFEEQGCGCICSKH